MYEWPDLKLPPINLWSMPHSQLSPKSLFMYYTLRDLNQVKKDFIPRLNPIMETIRKHK